MNPITTVALVEVERNPTGVQLVNSDRTNKMGDPMDLVELAELVQKADEFTLANATNKLTVIAEQIRYLQEKARTVLEEAKRDNDLHHAACNVKKRPGQIYYLYKRTSGQKYFSMLSPEEWGASCPHEFLGDYKLEYDMSWTPANKIEERSKDLDAIQKLVRNQVSIEYFDQNKPVFNGLSIEGPIGQTEGSSGSRGEDQ